MRSTSGFALVAVLLASMASVGSAAASEGSEGPNVASGPGDRLELYSGEVGLDTLGRMRADGLDIVATEPGSTPGTVHVEVVVSATDIAELDAQDIDVDPVVDDAGRTTSASATVEADNGFEVWRSYGEPGGIRDEIVQLAADHPDLLKLVSIGRSINGQEILALKLTRRANKVPDGHRPSVLYSSAQHAREWITVETNRRLLHHYLDNYATDRDIRELVDRNELWFVLVANPDGYDHTFTDGQRLWRKNLRDNDGDGVITTSDGVDLNRNWPVKWGYDDEGSSPDIGNQTYRGAGPASEPETQALDGLMRRIRFDFQVNYHSAAELLLYGIGWQVATPSPDDIVYAALAGDDENPAVPGYDPDLSAELYTTNGETTEHAHSTYGTLAYTPELDTCDSAEAIFSDDEFGETYCEDDGRSVFEFPDDEDLVQAVFEKNLPFALSVAESATDPTNPVSSVGLDAPDFVVDSFDVSYGGDVQTVAVEAPRNAFFKRMYYRVDGGRIRSAPVRLWGGGERYGGDLDFYYGEYRGEVRGARPGDDVEVFFSSFDITRRGRFGIPRFDFNTSEPFSYRVEARGEAPVLILANEDQLGFGPVQNSATPLYVDTFGAALDANGLDYDVWDVATQGAPHPLGVLGHYDAIVWELGDNRLTQEAGDVETETPFGPIPDISVAEAQQFTTIAVRDYLNEGGKVFQSGEYTAYFGEFAGVLGGAYYALNGDISADCVITDDFFGDCLIYSDDFAQYYQGVYQRSPFRDPSGVVGVGAPLEGQALDIVGSESPNSGSFVVTSDVLPVDEFPQFASSKSAEYVFDGPAPFGPFEGDGYAAAVHSDDAWMRLGQTVDLTAATTASLGFAMSYDLETGYDHAVVEVRAAGADDWTTLADTASSDGTTSTATPTECEAGFFFDTHPDLAHYITLGDPCTPTGSTGEWNSFTGNSGGWTDVVVDLTPFVGDVIEVSISYITDPGSGGTGVFVDNTVVTVDDVVVDEHGFEDGLGSWSVLGEPATSPGNGTDWIASPALFDIPAAAVTTDDTVTFGFGFEAIATAEQRAAVLGAVLDDLLGGASSRP